MYKYLLCWRYLRTRKIALASVVSVTLGVATMIVVNAVMAGFSAKMRDRLHGVLSDLEVRSIDFDGFTDPDAIMALIEKVGDGRVVAMTPTLETPAMMTVVTGPGQTITRPVQLIGIDPEGKAKTGDFRQYLFDQDGKAVPPSLDVAESLRAHSPAGEVMKGMSKDDPEFEMFSKFAHEEVPDLGAFVGYALATHHIPGAKKDFFLAPMGAKVIMTFPTAGKKPEGVQDSFAVVGYFKSGMSEYDSSFVYVPIERLQFLRGVGNGKGRGKVSHVQIKTKPGTDLDQLALQIQSKLDLVRPLYFVVQTWEQKQGPILAAVALEQSILNILLFFIIAVAGFGILAIFSMIVVEKTRDIGILKALGATTAGVRGIFLGYGLTLGLVGSGIGMLGGLAFVHKINWIEEKLSKLTGRKVFDDSIYYFDQIPTKIDAATVAWIVGGALLIAVGASVLPAQRASKLRPVQALRFE